MPFCCSCEYVTVRDLVTGGVDTVRTHHVTGNQTGFTYESQTDWVQLDFCYRADSFSSRNIHVEVSAQGNLNSHQVVHFCTSSSENPGNKESCILIRIVEII